MLNKRWVSQYIRWRRFTVKTQSEHFQSSSICLYFFFFYRIPLKPPHEHKPNMICFFKRTAALWSLHPCCYRSVANSSVTINAFFIVLFYWLITFYAFIIIYINQDCFWQEKKKETHSREVKSIIQITWNQRNLYYGCKGRVMRTKPKSFPREMSHKLIMLMDYSEGKQRGEKKKDKTGSWSCAAL